ncbi:hypothetical protein BaRGS_00037935 [Batillaria attramentaria]|uniref:Uncharacterized protein n=1 Tax=Batillaria attramentaria TaxID=370345 RepID=A0ABD0J793_9CAEN
MRSLFTRGLSHLAGIHVELNPRLSDLTHGWLLSTLRFSPRDPLQHSTTTTTRPQRRVSPRYHTSKSFPSNLGQASPPLTASGEKQRGHTHPYKPLI